MTVRVFLILPPVRMGFINHDISAFISDKTPIFDFFLPPRMIRVKRAHCQKQMDMRIAIPFVVDKKNPDRHGIRIPVLDENGIQKIGARNRLQWKRVLTDATGW